MTEAWRKMRLISENRHSVSQAGKCTYWSLKLAKEKQVSMLSFGQVRFFRYCENSLEKPKGSKIMSSGFSSAYLCADPASRKICDAVPRLTLYSLKNAEFSASLQAAAATESLILRLGWLHVSATDAKINKQHSNSWWSVAQKARDRAFEIILKGLVGSGAGLRILLYAYYVGVCNCYSRCMFPHLQAAQWNRNVT